MSPRISCGGAGEDRTGADPGQLRQSDESPRYKDMFNGPEVNFGPTSTRRQLGVPAQVKGGRGCV